MISKSLPLPCLSALHCVRPCLSHLTALTGDTWMALELMMGPHPAWTRGLVCSPVFDQMPIPSGPPVLMTNWLWIQGFPPILRFDNLLEQSQNSGKQFFLLLPVYNQGYNSGTAKWKRCMGQVCREGHRAFLASWSATPPGRSSWGLTQKLFKLHCSGVSMEVSL